MTVISNIETEHGITIKGCSGPIIQKLSPLSVQLFRVQVAIPFHDTVISNKNSCFAGEAVELGVIDSAFNPALHPDDGTFLRSYDDSELSTLANFYGENAEVTFEEITYSSLAITNGGIARRMTSF